MPPRKKPPEYADAPNPAAIRAVEKAKQTKPKRSNGSGTASNELNCTAKREEISAAVSHAFHWWDYQPVKTDDECAERLNEFFKHCMETGELPNVEKMSLALGVHPETLRGWEHGKLGAVRSAMVKKAKSILAAIDAELAATNKMNVAAYIFRAKNFYGMKDQAEVTVTHTSDTPDKTPAELAEKYISATVIDIDDFTVETENDHP